VIFKGVGVALVTPFLNDEINFPKLAELIEMQISNKTDAIIILGSTAECSTLTDEEKIKIIDFTLDVVNRRIPVIVGTGTPSTKKTIELSKYATKKGADSLLIVTPYYNKPNQRGLYAHYEKIAKEVDNNIILYNVPSRTNVNLSSDVVIELTRFKNIVGIKEASGDLLQINRIIQNTRKDFAVYSGNDDQTLDILKLGGVGVISVIANFLPKEFGEIIHAYLDGDYEKCKEGFNKFRTLMQLLFIETNPVPVKEVMNLLGYDVGLTRLPLVPLSEKSKTIIKQCLIDLGLIK